MVARPISRLSECGVGQWTTIALANDDIDSKKTMREKKKHVNMFFFFILAMSSNVSRPIQSYRECVTVIFLLCVALHFLFPFFFQINVKKSTAQSVHCSTFSILFGWSTLFSVQNKLDNISITHRTTLSRLNTTHHTIHSIAHWLVACNMKKEPPTTEQIMHSKFTKERN